MIPGRPQITGGVWGRFEGDTPEGYVKPGPVGAMVAVLVCARCGALILCPDSSLVFVEDHDAWHQKGGKP